MKRDDRIQLGKDILGKLLLLVGSVTITLAAAELSLRLAGFVFSLEPAVQFGWPDPITLRRQYRVDPVLLWVPEDYPDRLRVAASARPTVVFMGDSCTEFGTYAEGTMERLAEERSGWTSGLNAGVGGWSTEQGRRQLVRDIVPLRPDFITIYYGWNDHWVALGPVDSALPLSRAVGWLETHLRLAQVVLKVRLGASALRESRPNRVPLERYEENLRFMVHTATAAGIVPILITAPTNHVTGREPPYLLERHLRSLDELVPMHAAYLDVTRLVAAEEGAFLCDAAAEFTASPSLNTFFNEDGIHLSEAGNERLAVFLSECLLHARAL